MSGLEKIIEKINEDADRQVRTIMEEARETITNIARQTQQAIDEKRKAMKMRAQDAASIKKERLISMAKMEGAKHVLQTKRALIDQVNHRVLETLEAMPDDEFEQLLVRLIVYAKPSKSGYIRLGQKEKKRVGEDFVDKVNRAFAEKGSDLVFEVDLDSDTVASGFMIISKDVEINGSFEKLLEYRKSELEPLIVDALFAKD